MKRLYSLDALRGVAALAVVVWHWQHFYALGGDYQDGWQRSAQPFYGLLKPLYDGGWVAVDLFFALSGFVFFWLYADVINGRRVGAGRFAQLRLSRLYPLHFLTLGLVAGLQMIFLRHTGQYFIFDAGDGWRFTAALAMAQQWLPPTEDQFFNGPAWSVSVEVLVYILFFAACRLGRIGPWRAALVAVAGALLMPLNGPIARGIAGFFLGGLVFYAVAWARVQSHRIWFARGASAAAGLAWLAVIVGNRLGLAMTKEMLLGFIFLVSPLTIAALALNEPAESGWLQYPARLGDISYSTYLLHFPLQLVCVLAAQRYGWQPADFMQPWVMALFFAVLIALGTISHYGFERPMQKLLRGVFARPAEVPQSI